MSIAPTLERAWHLYRLRRFAAAIEATMEYLAKYPESAEAHCVLALCHGKEKRRAASIQAGKAAVGFKPDWSYPHYVLSLTSFWFDDYELSLRALSEALRINPEDPDFHELLASIHSEKGMFRTARECAENGLSYDPEHLGCLYLRGACLFEEKRLKEAEEVFRVVLRINPEHTGSQGFLGYIENSRGNYQVALPLLSNALRGNPGWSFAQTAWKETLRGCHPVYGAIARMRVELIELHPLRYFGSVFTIVALLMVLCISDSPDLRGTNRILAFVALSALGTIALFLFIMAILTTLQNVLRVYLQLRLRELRLTTSLRDLVYAHWRWVLLLIFIIALVIDRARK